MRAPEAYFAPEPRLALMDELGHRRAVMWPTLASVLEERLADDPRRDPRGRSTRSTEWMHEQWTFNYEDRIFATPVITLPIVDQAIEELEWVVERGASVVLIRPAPVPGLEGIRSFALPEFDPFWEKVVEADIAVGMHASDDGVTKYINVWEGRGGGEFLPFANWSGVRGDRAVTRTAGSSTPSLSAVGHGLFSRFPTLRVLPVENGSNWVRPLLEAFAKEYDHNPHLFDEDPVEVFKRNVWVHPFHEEDPVGIVDAGRRRPRACSVPTTRTPRGWPTRSATSRCSKGFAHDDIARIMGGNLAEVLKLAA